MEFLAFLYTFLLVAICLMMALLLYRSAKPTAGRDDAALKEWLHQQLEAQNRQTEAKLAEMNRQNLAAMGQISETLQASVQSLSAALTAGQGTQQQTMEQRLQGLEMSSARKLEEMRKTLADGMTALQTQNAQKLDEIRHTVDEQLQDTLQKRVTESFKAVNDQLEQVYKGLGEMQNLAADVGGLKQVLSGVKTRGILGEIQLGAILEEILAPEQYDTNVATIPGSTQRVEYAIRMPGADGGSVWLPIDSKFPQEDYIRICEAAEKADKEALEAAQKALEQNIKNQAKTIAELYINVPKTTDFAIMFLATEGLYSEVLRRPGLCEEIQNKYRIMICGPTTITAFLNTLNVGFRTIALNKKTTEIQKTLSAVSSQYDLFESLLAKAKKKIDEAGSSIEAAQKRNTTIQRKLHNVDKMDADEAEALLNSGE